MKNLVYSIVIGICVIGAVVVFVKWRGGRSGSINSLPDSQMTWVKCTKCGASYEMSEKEFYKQQEQKARENPSPIPVALPLKCEKCGQDGIVKADKCPKCGEVFRVGSVPGDFEDRCPKCKYSAREARWKERTGQK